jgi:hypothetical protein
VSPARCSDGMMVGRGKEKKKRQLEKAPIDAIYFG